MSITENKNQTIVLETKSFHYAMGIGSDNMLHHIHWGDKADVSDYSVDIYDEHNSNHSPLDIMNLEYTPYGGIMYRECALKCEFSDKTRDTVLVYKCHEINGDTLKVTLKDSYYPMEVDLVYSVFYDNDVISRNAVIRNCGEEDISVERAFSAEFSLPSRRDYTVYNDLGTWGGENQVKKQKLSCGSLNFESRKGNSGHGNDPYFIAAQNETEDSGEVYFATLAYGGNFKVCVNKDSFGITRAVIGLNDFDFIHILHSGDELVTPEVYFGYAHSLCDMSNNMNDFAVEHVFPSQFNHKPLPVLYNSWEATGFDVTIDGQKALADKAKALGVELFVMDDGWFGERKDDYAGLGDWYVNKQKFPNGLSELIDYVNSLGMDFGLWVEPEMVNPNSDLFCNHPDWAYHYDTRQANYLRHQLVLNMTKKEVQDYIFDCLNSILSENNIKYIKWDMNRPFSETGAENLENGKMLWLLHTKAVYDIVDRLKELHPETQFESCSGGGGRCEYGSFKHFDEIWTSDNTNAVDRIDIQNGYSLLYPTKAMRAWVTDHGNAPIDFKCNIAMQGSLGIGNDLLKLSEKELDSIKKNIELYKKYRNTIQFGNRYRLMNLELDELNVNMYVSKDKKQAIAFIATPAVKCMHWYYTIKLKGLNPDAVYELDTGSEVLVKNGSYFMSKGIERRYGDLFVNEIWQINEAAK